MSTVDFRALLGTLVREEVDFVVIGALAVGAHGYVRATVDLDLVPRPDRDNLKRLRTALVELNATLPLADGRPFDPVRDAQALEDGKNMTLDTPFGGIDVIQRVTGVPAFEALSAAAVATDLLGVPVRVCSLEHLRQMKEATGRTLDLADLENLPRA